MNAGGVLTAQVLKTTAEAVSIRGASVVKGSCKTGQWQSVAFLSEGEHPL